MADQYDFENEDEATPSEDAIVTTDDTEAKAASKQAVSHELIDDMPLTDKIGRMSALLHRYTKNQAEAHGRFGDPLRGQGRLLTLLKAKPETSQRELSFLLDMRQQSLSELLAKLEEKGFITREKSEDDGRVTMVKLTEAGASAAPDVEDMDPNKEVFDCLTDEERKQFEETVVKVTNSLEQKLIEMGDDPNAKPRREEHDDRGGRGGFRGGRDDRGGRGGYRGGRDDDRRGGYRGGRDDRGGRGGYRGHDDRDRGGRGGYRGGRDDRGGRGGYRGGRDSRDRRDSEGRHDYRNSSFYPSRSDRNRSSED